MSLKYYLCSEACLSDFRKSNRPSTDIASAPVISMSPSSTTIIINHVLPGRNTAPGCSTTAAT